MLHDHREAIAGVLALPGVHFSPDAGRLLEQADALLGSDVLAQIRAEARAEGAAEARARVEAHMLIGLAAGRAEAWDEGWLAAEESWGHEEPNEVNPYRTEGSA